MEKARATSSSVGSWSAGAACWGTCGLLGFDVDFLVLHVSKGIHL